MKNFIFILLSMFVFVTFASGQTLRVSTPNGGEVWQDGNTHTIVWSASGVSGNIVVELIRVILNRPSYGTAKVLFSGNVNHNRKSFRWVIRENIRYGKKNTYRIRITSTNNGSIRDMSDSDFTIIAKELSLPPAGKIEITNPTQTTVWNIWSAIPSIGKYHYTITWKKTGVFSPSTRLRITLNGLSGPARKFSALLTASTENDGHLYGDFPSRYPTGRYRIKIRKTGTSKLLAESKVFKVIKKMHTPLSGLKNKQ